MSTADISLYAIPAALVCYLIWSTIDSKRVRDATVGRSQAVMEAAERNITEALEISRKQLEVAEKTLEEIKALRKILESKG